MKTLWQEFRLLLCAYLLRLILKIAPKNHEEGIILVLTICDYVKKCLARKKAVK